MSKQFWGVVIAIFVVFAGIFALSGDKTNKESTKPAKGSLTQHVVGKGQAGVTLVEYGDFQCPFCAQYHPVLKEVKAKYNDQIKFQFRHFPLQSIHQNAFAGARAAEAAGLQGKFWEMHDLLYENQTEWSEGSSPTTHFEGYAKQLGLNVEQFKKDFASSQVNASVNADLAEANRLKLTGTPAFFLNGKKVEISQTLSSFEKVIDAEIAKNKPAGSSSSAQ